MKFNYQYSSRFRILSKGRVALAISAMLANVLYAAPQSNELPTNPSIVHGNIGISSSAPNNLTINQATNQGIINWGTFNIGSAASVRFNQPNTNSTTLNRVVGGGLSQIAGSLSANGSIILINPNGVVFQNGSSVNVGSIVATTMNLKDEDFLSNNLHFTRDGSIGAVINQGTITANDKGYVALLAPTVQNEGVIKAVQGTVAFASGDAVTLDFNGDGLLNVEVDGATVDTLIENKALVQADGGLVYMSSKAATDAYASTVSNSGTVSATSMSEVGGKIVFLGSDISNSGNIEAKGKNGGGEILLGGDWQGSNSDIYHEATTVTATQDSIIDASAIESGDGGKVVLWSDVSKADSITTAKGTILSKGGVNSGDGGKIETSGHTLDIAGATVDASASNGQGGLWLLDPTNITITQAYADTLETTLNGGADIAVQTNGEEQSNIVFDSNVILSTAVSGDGEATLTFNGDRIQAANGSTIEATTGKLNVVFIANNNATGGDGVELGTINTNGGGLWVGAGTASTWVPYEGASPITVGSWNATGGAGSNLLAINVLGNINTNGGNVKFIAETGTGGSTDISSTGGSYTINTGSGDITFLQSELDYDYYGHTLSLITTGTLTIAPANGQFFHNNFSNTPAALTWNGTLSGGNLTGSDSIAGLVINNFANLGGLTIGSSTSTTNSDVTITSAINIAGPISLYGSNITLNNNLASTNSGEAILLNASSSISTANSAKTITTNNGDISIIGDSDANGAGQLDLDYTTYTAGTGDIVFRGETFSWTTGSAGVGPTISNTTGTFTFESSDNIFGQGVDTAWFNFPTTLSGFTIGKSTNTANIDVSTALNVAGPISIYGGNINLNADIDTQDGGVNGDILFKASGNIIQAANVDIATAGGDVTYWSDTNDDGGFITLRNSATVDTRTASDRTANNGESDDTSGGAITMGGGSASTTLGSGTVVPIGYALKAVNTQVGGIEFGTSGNAGILLLSGGGDILLRGKSTIGYSGDVGEESNGILFNSGVTIDAGSSGDITLDGKGQNGNYNGGVYTSYQGLVGDTLIHTVNGDISITGESLGGGTSGNRGNLLTANSAYALTVKATGTGSVSITGKGTSHDIFTQNTINILAASGDITLEGQGDGSIDIQNTTTIGYKAATDITSSSSDIEIIDNTLTWGGSGLLNLNTSGTVVLKPYGDDFSGALSTSNIGLSSDITGLTIGKSATSYDGTNDVAVTIANAIDIAGAVNIYGSNINLNADIDTQDGGANGDILFKVSGNIIQAASVDIDTAGADVTYWANSDDETTNGGYIYLQDNTTIDTRTSSDRTANDGTANDTLGGAITMGGGAGTTVPTGYALNNTLFANFGISGAVQGGISLGTSTGTRHNSGISIISGGGDISLKGKHTSTTNSDSTGISAYEGFTIDAGSTGDITLVGDVTGAGSYSDGINLGNWAGGAGTTASYIKTVNGDITLTGTASDATTCKNRPHLNTYSRNT